MAESILRLKVSSEEYDNKLKRAAEGIQRLASKIHDSQGEFVGLTNDQKEFIRNLQYMNTVSQTATGKVKELETAYKGLQTMYNGFNAFEKNSEEGKILAEQLSILKEKTLQARKEMEDANKSLSNTGGFLDQLTSKFTVNIDALKLFDIGMKASGAALDVAKDAFFASESNVDEWGRTIQAAQSVYEGFLISINNGDISGFLSNIDDIVKAARAAYNELDKLNTMRTIQSPGFAKQEAENNRMRTMLMTGKWISAADGRVSPLGLKDGDKLTPEMMRVIERQLQGGMNKIVSLTKNEIGQTGRAIDAYYNSLAKQNGMSLKEFRSGTSSWESFSQKMAGYEAYKKWDAQARTEFAKQGGRGYVDFDKNNPYAEFRKWGTFRVDKMGENSYNDLVNLIKQQQSQQSQLYSTMGQAYRTMNRVNGVSVRDIMGGGGSGGGGGRSVGGGSMATSVNELTEMQSNQQRINELTQEYVNISDQSTEAVKERQVAIRQEISELEKRNGVLKLYQEQAKGKFLGGDVQKTGLANSSLSSSVSGTFDVGTGLSPEAIAAANQWIKNMEEGGNKVRESWKNAASAISLVGTAMSAVKDPAAQIASTVAMAIANIAMAYSESLAKDTTNKSNIWYFIATAAAAMVSMATTISSIHSATGYAEGGMIKGNSYSGDNIGGLVDGSQLVGLNAGEIVLNQAQTSNVANALKGGGMGNMHLTARLDGKDLLLSIDRTGQTMGYGQLVFFK